MSKHIAVLMGGWSAEREVSLRSGAACAAARTAPELPISRTRVRIRPAGRFSSSFRDSSAAASRLSSASRSPRCANALAACFPSAPVAPVMTTTRSLIKRLDLLGLVDPNLGY